MKTNNKNKLTSFDNENFSVNENSVTTSIAFLDKLFRRATGLTRGNGTQTPNEIISKRLKIFIEELSFAKATQEEEEKIRAAVKEDIELLFAYFEFNESI